MYAMPMVRVRVMVFNGTFYNISAISWRSALLVEETGKKPPNCRKYDFEGNPFRPSKYKLHILFIYEADANDKIYQI